MKKRYVRKLALWIFSVFLLAALLPGCGSRTAPGKERASVQETAASAELQTDGETEEVRSAKAAETDAAERDETEPSSAGTEETGPSSAGMEETEPPSAGTEETEPSSAGISEPEPANGEIDEDGSYTSRDEVALYLYTYGHLPDNFITKNEAKKLGWDNSKGNLAEVAPGKSIGGDRFGNYEGLLPEEEGRRWTECDIGYEAGYRNGERIVFSNDGLIYYTGDHYKSFEQLY